MTDKEAHTYKLSLKGDGIALDREVSKDLALSIINIALGGATAVGTGSSDKVSKGGAATSEAGERVTPGEFLEDRNAATNSEKIAAFGVYLKEMRGQENFTREDIKAMFRAAHETSPANFGRDFRAALASNWIADEDDASDRYFVTKTGANAVGDQFASPRPRKSRRKASRKAAGSNED